MKKRRQLDRFRALRAMQCQQVKQDLSRHQQKLSAEEQRLERLEEYQKHYAWRIDRQANGLLLSSAQMMAESVHHAVHHQKQQVGVQQAQCNTAQQYYIRERVRLRTAEALLESHQKVLDKKAAKKDQKLADEMSARMLFL